MKRSISATLGIALLLMSASVFAHPGPRVWIGSEGGTLATFKGDNDTNPNVYTPQRVFIGGADEDTLVANGQLDEFPVPGTGIFATEFPAYQVRLDGNAGFGTGRSFGFNLAGPLLVFDPVHDAFRTSQSFYGNPGPAPKMGESAGAFSALSADGIVPGFSFFSYNSSDDHGHLVTTLYGDGSNPVDGPHAVYAVPMQLTTGGFNPSPTFYVLYGRAVSLDDPIFQEAIQTGNNVFTHLPGDANFDRRVDALDLGLLALHWQGTGGWDDGDFNFDGVVDVNDLSLLAGNWQRSDGSLADALVAAGLGSTSVPEPAALGLLALTASAALRRRRLWARQMPFQAVASLA